MQEWSNQSAFGYAIAAASVKGFTVDEIKELVKGLHTVLDTLTLEEAARLYRESEY